MLGSELELVVIFQGIDGNLYCVLASTVMCVRVFLNDVKRDLPAPPTAGSSGCVGERRRLTY